MINLINQHAESQYAKSLTDPVKYNKANYLSIPIYYVPSKTDDLEIYDTHIVCSAKDLNNQEKAIEILKKIGKYTFLDRAMMFNSTPEKTVKDYVFKHIISRCSSEEKQLLGQTNNSEVRVPENIALEIAQLVAPIIGLGISLTLTHKIATKTPYLCSCLFPEEFQTFTMNCLSKINFNLNVKIDSIFTNYLLNKLAKVSSFIGFAKATSLISTINPLGFLPKNTTNVVYNQLLPLVITAVFFQQLLPHFIIGKLFSPILTKLLETTIFNTENIVQIDTPTMNSIRERYLTNAF